MSLPNTKPRDPGPSDPGDPDLPDVEAQPAPRAVRRAQWALVRFESRRALRHPAVLAALFLYAALWVHEAVSGGYRSQYPVLQDEDRYTQVPLLLLAAGALLSSNLAATRAQRSGAEPLCEVLPLPLWRRTLAQLTAVLPLAVLAALLATARIVYYGTAPTAVGEASLIELATGPCVVVLAGCAGVALARLTSSVSAGAFGVLLLGVLVLSSGLGVRGMKWLGPLAVENEFADPVPSDLMGRPAGLHLAYLAALTVLLALLSLYGTGLRIKAAHRALALLTVAAVTVTLGAAQYGPMPDELVQRRDTAEKRPAELQRCRTANRVTYCAFPEFMRRTNDWQGVADGILRRLPASRQAERYVVRQRLFLAGGYGSSAAEAPLAEWARDDARHGTAGAVTAGTQWGRTQIKYEAVLGFAMRFANRVVPGRAERFGTLCDARAVIVLWLAVQATAETGGALRSVDASSWGGVGASTLGSNDSLDVSDPEVRVVRDLLDQPAAQVGAKLRASWPELVDADTGTAKAARLLGVSAPANIEKQQEGTACAPQ